MRFCPGPASVEPRYDGYYISGLQRHEDWHAGVQMVSVYHRYLKLFENGLWLSKNHPTPCLDFSAYLGTLTEQAFQAGLEGQDPYDSNYDLLHQTGSYTRRGNRLDLVNRCFDIIMHERRWELRVESADRLVNPDGICYHFTSVPG